MNIHQEYGDSTAPNYHYQAMELRFIADQFDAKYKDEFPEEEANAIAAMGNVGIEITMKDGCTPILYGDGFPIVPHQHAVTELEHY